MKIASDFLAALIRGKITLEDTDGTKGWVPLTHIKLKFGMGTTLLQFYKGDILIASNTASFDPASGNTLTLSADHGFEMKLEVEIHP
ncbi:hypothetical protein UFOVP228_21 [uncultured Caudovirales phage]|uniref:Uncharacterized protein n=1 Tax=uncultured Caudovirales phage TaxID=2100421 RepID=A0A6J7WLT9_9CAUD|nr:hypothetical protein UFOVP47_81 [uncultured Caudovirales phage]CAB5219061.1 hypothetical protein UFOVP228_21 [uncultured Caudovirales phage]